MQRRGLFSGELAKCYIIIKDDFKNTGMLLFSEAYFACDLYICSDIRSWRISLSRKEF